MKLRRAFPVVMSFASLLAAMPAGAARTSAAYTLRAEVIDGGGGRGASTAYGSTGSIGTVSGAQTSAAYGNTGGYLPHGATTVPTVILTGSNPLTVEAAASFTDPGASASDVEDGTLTPQLVANTVVANVPGTYSTQWRVTDHSGLTALATRTVTVVDTTAPLVTAPTGNLVVPATSPAGAVVHFTPTASDVVGVTMLGAAPASGTLFPTGATTVTVSAADAANNIGTGQFTVTVTPLTVRESWRHQFFGTAANTGMAADTADWDRDGKVNLLEFGFGTDPTLVASGVPALEYAGTFAGSGTLVLPGQPRVLRETAGSVADVRALFVRRVDHVAVGLTYTVEFGAEIGTWEASATTPTVLATNGTHEVVAVPFPATVAGQPARFVRVQVTLAPPP